MPNQHSTAAPPWFAGPAPKVLTYVYPDPEPWEPEFQLQWDYQIEWQSAGEPKIKLLRFRSYQRTNVGDKRVLVEEFTHDIPNNEQIAMNIATHAAGYLFANANLSGEWRFADRSLLQGCAEASKKRFSLASLRQLMQADPNPRLT